MNNVNQSVSAGIGGFIVTFVLALALWLLVRNMNARLRNVAYREEAEEERLAREGEPGMSTRPRSAAETTPTDSESVADSASTVDPATGEPTPGSTPTDR